jgi:hypothetical protein
MGIVNVPVLATYFCQLYLSETVISLAPPCETYFIGLSSSPAALYYLNNLVEKALLLSLNRNRLYSETLGICGRTQIYSK